MDYALGVDLGTTYTAAAVARDGRLEICDLGTRSATVPSVVYLDANGTVLTGDAALRRSTSDPTRLARDVKRRMGDTTAVLLGGTPYSVDALMARQLEAVVAAVSEREGGPPAAIAVSHPANWGPYKLDLMRQVVTRADLRSAVLVTEPHAAAVHYASQHRLRPGSVVVVYDLGGGTFDVAVMRAGTDGFELLGEPEGIERLGGIDFDQAVLSHVARSVGPAIDALDPEDPIARAAMARLLDECVQAKEALSSDTEVSVPVLLPSVQTQVRLTRAEFESMIRPSLGDTILVTLRALRSAGVSAEELEAVLLVGGSSRIPLIAQMVGSELGRPIALDAHPKHAVALGAAAVAASSIGRHTAAATLAATPAAAVGPSESADAMEPTAVLPVTDPLDLPPPVTTARAAVPVVAVAAADATSAAAPAAPPPQETHDDAASVSDPSADPGADPGADAGAVGAFAEPSWPQPPELPPTNRRRRTLIGSAAAVALLVGGGLWASGQGDDEGRVAAGTDAAASSTSAAPTGSTGASSTQSTAPASTPTSAPASTGSASPDGGPTTTAVASQAPLPPGLGSETTLGASPTTSPARPTQTTPRVTTPTTVGTNAPASPTATVAPAVTSPATPTAPATPTTPPPTTPTTAAPTTAAPTTVATTTTTTTPPTTTTTAPPPSPPTVGVINVSKVGGGEVVFSAPNASRCGTWSWTLNGPVSSSRSGGSVFSCLLAAPSWDTRSNDELALPDGAYTVTLTIDNGAGSRSSTARFTMP